MSNWDALLSAKRLADQMGQLTEARERYTTQLHARIDEHKQVRDVLSPFVDYLDRGWDLSRELWDQADLDLLKAYADLLEHEDDLRRLAELLGRMHDAETQSEEEELSRTIHTERWVSDPTQRTEIVGIRTSDELPHVLTSEFALSGDPLLEDRFLQKLADKRLLSFAFSDRRKVTDTQQLTEVHTHTRRRVKGPFILCVDTSYSMAGDAERLAKVLAFGILRVAIEEDREAYLINFSVQIRTMDLRNVGRNLDELAAFLRMSFHGGTDVTLAFTEAIRKLDEGRYADADVLVVSDFIMLRMSTGVLDDVRSHQHNNGTRFHALTFQDRPSSELQAASTRCGRRTPTIRAPSPSCRADADDSKRWRHAHLKVAVSRTPPRKAQGCVQPKVRQQHRAVEGPGPENHSALISALVPSGRCATRLGTPASVLTA